MPSSLNSEPLAIWEPLARRITLNDGAAVTELYQRFRWVRSGFLAAGASDLADDLYHEVIVDVIGAIQRGLIREMERLPGYVRVIARRKLFEHRRLRVRGGESLDDLPYPPPDSGLDPERQYQMQQQREIAERILKALPEQHRQVLIRFYLLEESQESIQAELGLTPTQFRLIKSRAKERFAHLGRNLVKPNSPAARAETATALIVDDQTEVRLVLAAMLRCHGYRVYTAGSALEALTLFDRQQSQIDVLITDQCMPGMTGSDLARKLTARRIGLKVVIVSGRQTSTDFEIDTGWRYLSKPIASDVLYHAVSSAAQFCHA